MIASKLKRYADIATFLVKFGRSDIVANLSSEFQVERPENPSEQASIKDLGQELQRLGPTFVKLGQLLSSQTNALPVEYLEELEKLQDKADPFPFEEAEKIIESELGIKLKTAFEEFDPKPVAAASLSQVHRAVLHSGTEVAVKVQRPNIEENIQQDLEILETIVTLLEKNTEWAKRYSLVRSFKHLRTNLLNELDFKREARNLVVLKKNLTEFTDIEVPSPIPDYTSRRVLTMQYMQGTKITKLSPVVTMERDVEHLAESLLKAYLKQVAVDGFFHTDPHPGNIYLGEQKLIILDLGMVGRIPPRMQGLLLQLLFAISEGQGEDTADILVKMGRPLKDFDHYALREQISDLVIEYYDVSLSDVPMGRVVLNIAQIAANAGLEVPSQLTTVGKMMLSLDQVIVALSPHIKSSDIIQQHTARLIEQRLRQDFSLSTISRTVIESGELFKAAPAQLKTILDWLSRNEMKLQVELPETDRFLTGLEKVANRIAAGVVVAALFVSVAILMSNHNQDALVGPNLAYIFLVLAAVGTGLLVFFHLWGDNKKN
ncbi:MAG: AarF/UbiB family protein [Chlamydiales bacterium]|nr:AarF/UbiB family protein [Chlamydiales bacterium]